jgi:hypothetical protein
MRAHLLIAAVIGALLSAESAAFGQAGSSDLPNPPSEPKVSLPQSAPRAAPTPVGTDSSGHSVEPTPALPGATPQAPSLAEPITIHEHRSGFVLAGGLVVVPAYLLQVVAAAGISLSATDSTCSSCYQTEARLFLLPIVGPWLGSRAAPAQERGSPVPYLIWGGVEAAGAAMLIVGLVGHDVPLEPVPQGPNIALLPFITPQAEGISALLHW